MLKDIRKNYQKSELADSSINSDPFELFSEWMKAAFAEEDHEPNAMVLSTMDLNGNPDSRVVLLKEINSEGLFFFTNFNSRKSIQIAANPNVSVVFFWSKTERQIRVKGIAEKISEEYSEEYFNSRPTESKLGAWASPQSQIIESRQILDDKFAYYKDYFQYNEIRKPPHWGGFLIRPVYFEFWQGRANRLHDRIEFNLSAGEWIIHRLAP